MNSNEEFPLIETPRTQRKGLLPITMVLLSFTFLLVLCLQEALLHKPTS